MTPDEEFEKWYKTAFTDLGNPVREIIAPGQTSYLCMKLAFIAGMNVEVDRIMGAVRNIGDKA